MLTRDGCQQRLGRLRRAMADRGVDTAVIAERKNVYYFSGHLSSPHTRAALVVTDATATLAAGALAPLAAEQQAALAATDVRTFVANAHASTIRPDQDERLAELVAGIDVTGRVGGDLPHCPLLLAPLLGTEPIDLTDGIRQMRRTKDADELTLLRQAAACVDACYAHARQRIEPGLNELTLHGELYRVAVETAGEEIDRFGQDFQSASVGGPSRDRAAGTGELWILDLGVEYRGYTADASRAFAVSGVASDAQQEAWQLVAGTLQAAADDLRAGASCLQLFQDARAALDARYPGAFFHHLGHGLGLAAHEAPYLNPEFDDHLVAGDVVTVEPGVYDPSLVAGIRLENDFVITDDGAEQITHAELGLER